MGRRRMRRVYHNRRADLRASAVIFSLQVASQAKTAPRNAPTGVDSSASSGEPEDSGLPIFGVASEFEKEIRMKGCARTLFFMLLAAVLIFQAGPVSAQVTTATIMGTVKDDSGAVLPGVSVVIKDTDTGIS